MQNGSPQKPHGLDRAEREGRKQYKESETRNKFEKERVWVTQSLPKALAYNGCKPGPTSVAILELDWESTPQATFNATRVPQKVGWCRGGNWNVVGWEGFLQLKMAYYDFYFMFFTKISIPHYQMSISCVLKATGSSKEFSKKARHILGKYHLGKSHNIGEPYIFFLEKGGRHMFPTISLINSWKS